MKMYIAIRESVPTGHAVNSAAHGSLMCYLKYQDNKYMQEWLDHSFKKVTCVVSDAEFELLKQQENIVVITESALNNQEVAIVLAPRIEWPYWMRSLKLFK